MKRAILLISLAILFFSLTRGSFCGEEDVRIILDKYHAYQDPSVHLRNVFLELKDKEDRNYIIRSYEKQINSSLLSDFDILVLFVPSEPYEKEERGAITQFVENGGSLIIFGEHGTYMEENNIFNTINDISGNFKIRFNLDVVLDSEQNREGEASHPIIDSFCSHPVTEGVESIGYICGCSLDVPDSNTTNGQIVTKLAFGNDTTTANGQKGEDVVVLAVAEYGKGKVLAIGDIDLLFSSNVLNGENEDFLSFRDNKKLGLNMFEWAASVRKNTIEADKLASEGYALFSLSDYSGAKSEFEKAEGIYIKIADSQGLSEMQKMIDKCKKGMNARTTYEKGIVYYNNKDYERAKSEFETSRNLYDQIKDSENFRNAQFMIDACEKYIIAHNVYEEGMEYYNGKKFKEALATFKEALAVYQELEDTERTEELQTKIDETGKAIEKQILENRLMILFGIPVVVVIVFLIVHIFLKPETPARMDTSFPAEALYCSFCGKENPIGALYCERCGKPLKSSDKLAKEEASDILRKKLVNKEISEEEYYQAMKELEENL